MLERNYGREAMMARGSTGKWYTHTGDLFNLHVFSNNGVNWHWKINGLTTWQSFHTYESKDHAYQAGLGSIRNKLLRDIALVAAATNKE